MNIKILPKFLVMIIVNSFALTLLAGNHLAKENPAIYGLSVGMKHESAVNVLKKSYKYFGDLGSKPKNELVAIGEEFKKVLADPKANYCSEANSVITCTNRSLNLDLPRIAEIYLKNGEVSKLAILMNQKVNGGVLVKKLQDTFGNNSENSTDSAKVDAFADSELKNMCKTRKCSVSIWTGSKAEAGKNVTIWSASVIYIGDITKDKTAIPTNLVYSKYPE